MEKRISIALALLAFFLVTLHGALPALSGDLEMPVEKVILRAMAAMLAAYVFSRLLVGRLGVGLVSEAYADRKARDLAREEGNREPQAPQGAAQKTAGTPPAPDGKTGPTGL